MSKVDKFRPLLSAEDATYLIAAIEAMPNSPQKFITRKKFAVFKFKLDNGYAAPAYTTTGAAPSLHEQISSPEEIAAWLEAEMKLKLGEAE